jgi:hypothetical protein
MLTYQEFIESSSSEKTSRNRRSLVLSRIERGQSQQTSNTPIDRKTRVINLVRSSAKKAGLKSGANKSRKDINTPDSFYSTYPYDKYGDDFKHPKTNTKVDTEINTIASARKAASREAPPKFKSVVRRQRGNVYTTLPSKEVTRTFKEFRRRVVKTGGNQRGPVHKVDFHPRAENTPKNEMSKTTFKRGRNFIQQQKDLPKNLKKAGAKTKDITSGSPSAMMSNENPKKGRENRAKIYKNRFGRRVTSLDKTGRTRSMIGASN